MKTQYQWLLFDADDTLFDFQRAEALALEKAFQQVGAPFTPQDFETYQRINQQLWQAIERGELTPDVVRVRRFELLFETMQAALSPESFSQTYVEQLAARPELIDGAQQMLESLRGKYRLAIVTNGLREVQRGRLALSPIRDTIEALIISQEVGWAKPAREFFDEAFTRLGNPPRESALIIGDSMTSDIQGGADYGLDTCWYNPARKPRPNGVRVTYEIAQLSELVDLLA